MKKIALTGNIASGKSLVENYLKSKGFKTLCLDKVTKNIYDNNEAFKRELIKLFNTSSKKEISNIVFNDYKLLKKLEEIIYPIIITKMFEFFDKNKDEKIVIVDIPMLFEAGFDKYFDKIIFISASKEIRLERLQKRNNLNRDDAIKRIDSQANEEEKISKSDYVVKNEGTLEDLYKECELLIKELDIL